MAYVNRLRAKHGLGAPLEDLPKGRPAKTGSCPLAKALGPNAQVDGAFAEVGVECVRLPRYVGDFVERFDDGKYPDLIA